MKDSVPLRRRILQIVVNKGEATVSQVLAVVGRYISASQAANAQARQFKHNLGRGKAKVGSPIHTPQHLVERGRRLIVSDTLGALASQDKLIRVERGVYRRLPLRIRKETA